MSTRRVHWTQTTEWQNWVVSSAAAFSLSTDDPSLSVASAPMPTLQFDLGGRTNTSFAVTRPTVPVPAAASSLPPAGPMQNTRTAEPEEQPADGAPAAAAEQQPAEDAPAPSVEAPSEEAANQPEQAAAPSPEPKEPPANPAPAEADGPRHEANSQVELIIDSLTNHTLIEPIPVVIDALGGMMFTASMRNCDIQITGSSIGEALLVLKERIETVYEDLNRRWQHLDTEQRKQLKMLHTYIAPPKRPERQLGRR